jgi:hypothetical protein
MLNVPVGHFAEATAIWCGCVLLFVLVIGLRRVWIQRAKTLKMTARSGANPALDMGGERPADGRDFEALVRYMMRSPVSLRRLRFIPGAKEVVYTRKGGS